MGYPLSSAEDHAAFLQGCIEKKRTMKDVYENLGLFSHTLVPRRDPDLHPAEANELYTAIKQTAKSIASSCRAAGMPVEYKLSQENTLSSEAKRLGEKYGPAIWTPENKPNDTEWLNWSEPAHRDTILFYLRCWIVCVVLKGVNTTPQKQKGKGRVTGLERQENESVVINENENSDASEDAHRIPRAHMYSPSNNPKLTSPRNNNSTPSKRRAIDIDGTSPLRKLTKTPRDPHTRGIPIRKTNKDMYTIPPSPVSTPHMEATLFRSRTQREDTQDTDLTWRLRGETVDTETVFDSNEISQTEIHEVLEAATGIHQRAGYDVGRQASAGPSGTNTGSFRPDSVIPTEPEYSPESAANTVGSGNDISPSVHEDEEMSHAFQPSNMVVPVAPNHDLSQRLQRMDLFKLLVSYLHSLKQFSSDTYDARAEDRMDQLLKDLRRRDQERLQARFGDGFHILDAALDDWIGMRQLLSDFRRTTNYFGEPGRDWEAQLRRMESVPRAQATLAYVDFQAAAAVEKLTWWSRNTFDDELMTMFDALTMLKGCNGKEAFQGVRQFNTTLLQWFPED
ncbi:hypothetical protein ACN47E_010124 [Coniothyrium glycines]